MADAARPHGQRCKTTDAGQCGRPPGAHRAKAGLTQKELAALCQRKGLPLTRGTLAKIESGLRFIKAGELFIIAKALNLPLERFYPPGFGRG